MVLSTKSLFSSGVSLSVGTAAQAGVGVVAQLLLMRFLGPEDFGRFAITLAGCSLIQTLLSLRLNVLIIRLRDDEAKGASAELYQAALIWETLFSAVIGVLWTAYTGLLQFPAAILLVALAFGQWLNQIVAFYERGMDYRRLTLVESGSQIVAHCLTVVLVWLGFGPLALYLRELVAVLLRWAGFAGIGAILPPIWRWPRPEEIRLLLRQAKGIWLEGVLEGGFNRLVVLISGWRGGVYGSGLFAQSQRLAMIPHQFVAPVMSRMAANLFCRAEDSSRAFQILLVFGGGALLLLAAFAALVSGFSEAVVPWVFGSAWAEAGKLLPAMVGIIVFMSLFELVRAYCFAWGLVRWILVARLVQFAVFLAAAALSVSSHQPLIILAWGLSTAQVGAFLVLFTVAIIRSTKCRNVPPVPPTTS